MVSVAPCTPVRSPVARRYTRHLCRPSTRERLHDHAMVDAMDVLRAKKENLSDSVVCVPVRRTSPGPITHASLRTHLAPITASRPATCSNPSRPLATRSYVQYALDLSPRDGHPRSMRTRARRSPGLACSPSSLPAPGLPYKVSSSSFAIFCPPLGEGSTLCT